MMQIMKTCAEEIGMRCAQPVGKRDDTAMDQRANDAQAALAEIGVAMRQMAGMMGQMADMIRATNERMGLLEEQVAQLTKITPAQAREIGAAIGKRAAEVCQMHRAQGCERAAANAIRRAVRLCCGVRSMRELPRRDYGVAMQQIQWWDDYREMQRIRGRSAHGNEG